MARAVDAPVPLAELVRVAPGTGLNDGEDVRRRAGADGDRVVVHVVKAGAAAEAVGLMSAGDDSMEEGNEE